jgi:hypothetical protein
MIIVREKIEHNRIGHITGPPERKSLHKDIL